MADQRRLQPDVTPESSEDHGDDTTALHAASGDDAAQQVRRDERFRAVLARGDVRDEAAERRDRDAETRTSAAADPQSWIDRDWAGRDRDAAATDRADLLDLLREGDLDSAQRVAASPEGSA